MLKRKALLVSFLLLAGCASGPSLMQIERTLASQGIQEYHFDFSKTNSTGKLLIHTAPASQQLAIQEYGIKINGGETIVVLKRSNVEIVLDEGKYTVEMFSLPLAGKVFYGEIFGKPSSKEVVIKAGGTMRFEYRGPYSVMTSGKFREKSE